MVGDPPGPAAPHPHEPAPAGHRDATRGNATRGDATRLDLPRLVLAAPTSGAGKTTVATGLMAALVTRGLTVSPHKVGPDYIDPSYHALATGRPGRNLDAVLCGPERLAPLFAHAAAGADLAVIEGVMGLFDGVATPDAGQEADHASTAHVARLLRAPVVLVVDASGASRSIAALVTGFRMFDPRIALAGVILNRVGSDRHRTLLTRALAGIGMPVLGALPRQNAVHTPSRHLGLVPAAERRPAAIAAVDRLGHLIATWCDLDALLRVARAAPPLHTTAWNPADALTSAAAHGAHASTAIRPGTDHPTHLAASPLAEPRATAGAAAATRTGETLGRPADTGLPAGRPLRVAMAGGAAFTFGYTEHVELLRAAGAEVIGFDPLREETLPAGTDALILGGGFPEEHAGDLSANTRLRAQIAAFAAAGHPIHAECAGLLYLAATLDGAPMCGVLDIAAVMGPHLTLGYRQAVAATDSPLAAAGRVLGGHEFHRTVLLPTPAGVAPARGAPPAWWLPVADETSTAWPTVPPPATTTAAQPTRWRTEGFVAGQVHASYLHVHWAGTPDAPRRLLAAAHTARQAHHRRQAGPDAPTTDAIDAA
ncbi:Hydrogenobyrinate a,c-diamide synthase [Frankia sp. AiPs1]|uniref:cobyrinate a,c-diamide synthase n=1 Tax=Frankia sp. AiPa1 TaxID=573492 RepID=UPI00202B38F4|nr:cobyrinate a,c-diamide synthase [Frankia sp. AiPa1]MCL9759058.1 cobyrinate a,c-diamide synthase [Frankia sp. AiPa1]